MSQGDLNQAYARRPPRIVAVGGGKGGTGRTAVALGLACASARADIATLLIDADTTSPSLYAHFGLTPAPLPSSRGLSDPDHPIEPFIYNTPIPRLALLTVATSRHFPFVRPKLDVPHFLQQLRGLDHVERIIIDLPSGHDPIHLAMLALSDVPIFVVEPSLGGMLVATQHLRAAIFHALGFHPDCFDAEEELLMLMRQLPLHFDRDTILAPFLSAVGRRIVRETLGAFVPELVLNPCGGQGYPDSHEALAATLALCWRELIGVAPRVLGVLPRMGELTMHRPQAPDRPSPLEPALTSALEAIGDPIQRHRVQPRPLTEPGSPAGLLGLAPDAPSGLVAARLARVRLQLESGEGPATSLLPAHRLQSLRRAVELASEALEAQPVESARPAAPPARPAIDLPLLLANPPRPALLTAGPRPVEPDRTPELRPTSPPPTPSAPPIPASPNTAPPSSPVSRVPSAPALGSPPPPPRSRPVKLYTATAEPVSPSPAPEPAAPPPAAPEPPAPPPPVPTPASTTPDDDDDPLDEDDLDEDDLSPDPDDDSPDDDSPDDDGPDEPATSAPPPALPAVPPSPRSHPDLVAPPPPAPPVLVRRIPRPAPEGETPGHRIRRLRKANGMNLRELSLRTKIGIKYLQAIESADLEILPRPVYLRGYLREIAQVFDMDDAQLIEQYLQFLGHPT